MKGKIKAAIVALLLAGSAVITLTTPAEAAVNCPSGAFCLYSHPSAPYLIVQLPSNYPRNVCVGVSQAGNPVDFFDNGTSFIWYGFHTSNCTGMHIAFHRGWDGGMLGTFGAGWAEGKMHGVLRTSTVG